VVIAAATDEEAADLQRKQRLKVRTKIASETLSVGIAKVERVEADAGLDDDAIFSTPYFSVERVDGRGYAWRARRKISRGRVLLREEPLLVHAMSELMAADPVIRTLNERLLPYLSERDYPPEALRLLEEGAQRVAEHVHARLNAGDKRRYMALCDAFSPSKNDEGKTVGGVYRSNAFSRGDGVEGGVIYEVHSRINHSCAPNMIKDYDGFTAVTCCLQDVEAGQELTISYLASSDAKSTTDQRRETLQRKYNFRCRCERCEPTCSPGQQGAAARPIG
jgi:hypothetical protein